MKRQLLEKLAGFVGAPTSGIEMPPRSRTGLLTTSARTDFHRAPLVSIALAIASRMASKPARKPPLLSIDD